MYVDGKVAGAGAIREYQYGDIDNATELKEYLSEMNSKEKE